MIHFRPPYNSESINAQYKLLAKKYHPDAPGGSDQKMIEVNAERDFILDLLKISLPVKSRVRSVPGKKIRMVKDLKRRRKIVTQTVVILPSAKTILSILKEIRKFRQ